jgi:phosphate transport system permease protein
MISLHVQRRLINFVVSTLMYVATFVGLFFLAWILWTTLKMGISAMHWDLFTQDTPPPGTSGFGLRNAFVGSLILMGMAMVMGVPVGLMAGTWLAEYGGRSRAANFIRFVNDILLSAPSIEIGLFAYAILVAPLGHFSAFSGSVALAVLMIPIVVRTTDEMLKLVGSELREAAVALGAPIWKVITKITWKAARAGILTGILLALARISGETAPLLFTALNNQYRQPARGDIPVCHESLQELAADGVGRGVYCNYVCASGQRVFKIDPAARFQETVEFADSRIGPGSTEFSTAL